MPSDDWFAEASREVSKSDAARKQRIKQRVIDQANRRIENIRRMKEAEDAALRAATPGAARGAAAHFAAVSAGITPPSPIVPRSFGASGGYTAPPRTPPGRDYGTQPEVESRTIRPDKAVEALVETVRKAYLAYKPSRDEAPEEILEGGYAAALKAAGELITKVTNGISEELKQLDPEA